MKHKIIQMTATAGLTVPHSTNPIFKYIFDCLGKMSIRSISEIVAFVAQKIQTSSLRSRCTHSEWLFGTDFSTVASLGHFFRKWAKSCHYGQWRALPCHAQRIFVSKNWRGQHGHDHTVNVINPFAHNILFFINEKFY